MLDMFNGRLKQNGSFMRKCFETEKTMAANKHNCLFPFLYPRGISRPLFYKIYDC